MGRKPKQSSATKAPRKAQLLALSQIEEKPLVLDRSTLDKLEAYLEKNGGTKSGLTLSDAVAGLLLEKGPKGFKFVPDRNVTETVTLNLPKAAWDIADKSAKKSSAELADVIKELAAKL